MYSKEDLVSVGRQLRNRVILCVVPAAALAAGVVVSFLLRTQWLTVLLSILLGSAAIFCHGVFISPVLAYRRHIESALRGRTRETRGVFRHFAAEKAEREGVRFVPLTVNVGGALMEEDDRLFYYDANLPLPQWREGDRLRIESIDKAVVRWRKEDA